jgi:hypothetical protein
MLIWLRKGLLIITLIGFRIVLPQLQELNERFYVIMMEDSSDFVAEEQFLL